MGGTETWSVFSGARSVRRGGVGGGVGGGSAPSVSQLTPLRMMRVLMGGMRGVRRRLLVLLLLWRVMMMIIGGVSADGVSLLRREALERQVAGWRAHRRQRVVGARRPRSQHPAVVTTLPDLVMVAVVVVAVVGAGIGGVPTGGRRQPSRRGSDG